MGRVIIKPINFGLKYKTSYKLLRPLRLRVKKLTV